MSGTFGCHDSQRYMALIRLIPASWSLLITPHAPHGIDGVQESTAAVMCLLPWTSNNLNRLCLIHRAAL